MVQLARPRPTPTTPSLSSSSSFPHPIPLSPFYKRIKKKVGPTPAWGQFICGLCNKKGEWYNLFDQGSHATILASSNDVFVVFSKKRREEKGCKAGFLANPLPLTHTFFAEGPKEPNRTSLLFSSLFCNCYKGYVKGQEWHVDDPSNSPLLFSSLLCMLLC